MKRWGLFLLRVSTGWLLVMWGLDKVVNVEHAMAVTDRFYFGIGNQPLFLNIFGVLETILGALVVVGLFRQKIYPLLFAITFVSGLSVWQSILDPWGWLLEGSNVLLYPSLIITAGVMTLWGFIDNDSMALDVKKAA